MSLRISRLLKPFNAENMGRSHPPPRLFLLTFDFFLKALDQDYLRNFGDERDNISRKLTLYEIQLLPRDFFQEPQCVLPS